MKKKTDKEAQRELKARFSIESQVKHAPGLLKILDARAKADHTPTPWKLEKSKWGWSLVDAKGEELILGIRKDVAEKAIRACNAHDELVDFIETVSMGNTEYDDLQALAMQLLKKAEGR